MSGPNTSLILRSALEYLQRLDQRGQGGSPVIPRRIDIENGVRPVEGWRIQRELVPPGQESGAL
jgi:hypothetical protein